jgi:hypothetical protein
MSNAVLILDVAFGYVAGKLLWELALACAHQVGRLAVRLVLRLTRDSRSTENSGVSVE